MQYIMTEQYASSEEKPIAEFCELVDVKLFMTQKLSSDEDEAKEIVYRVYDDSVLLSEIKQKNTSVAKSKYSEGNCEINIVEFFFSVLMKSIDSSERTSLANFNDKNDAHLFVVGKCETDSSIIDSDLFFIVKGNDLLSTLNKTILNNQKKEAGRFNSGSNFRPTLRSLPPGSPSSNWAEDGNDEEC